MTSFEEFYRENYARTYVYSITLCQSPEIAEESCQQSFLELWKNWENVRFPKTWVSRAVMHNTYRCVREKNLVGDPPFSSDSLYGQCSLETHQELLAMLSSLTEIQRRVVALRYLYSFTTAEIAEILELPPSTVRSHLKRGLASLKEQESYHD